MNSTKMLAAAVAGIAACVPGAMRAEEIPRTWLVNATGACSGSLPLFEGVLRKRPTGISNDGSSSVFISCSMVGDEVNSGAHYVLANFANRGTDSATVQCTFVDGVVPELGAFPAAYYSKAMTLGAGEAGLMSWIPEWGETFSPLPNLSCILPPGSEINLVGYVYSQEVGAL